MCLFLSLSSLYLLLHRDTVFVSSASLCGSVSTCMTLFEFLHEYLLSHYVFVYICYTTVGKQV